MPVDVVRRVANLTGHVGPEVGRFPCSVSLEMQKVVTWSHEFLDQWAAVFVFVGGIDFGCGWAYARRH